MKDYAFSSRKYELPTTQRRSVNERSHNRRNGSQKKDITETNVYLEVIETCIK